MSPVELGLWSLAYSSIFSNHLALIWPRRKISWSLAARCFCVFFPLCSPTLSVCSWVLGRWTMGGLSELKQLVNAEGRVEIVGLTKLCHETETIT